MCGCPSKIDDLEVIESDEDDEEDHDYDTKCSADATSLVTVMTVEGD